MFYLASFTITEFYHYFICLLTKTWIAFTCGTYAWLTDARVSTAELAGWLREDTGLTVTLSARWLGAITRVKAAYFAGHFFAATGVIATHVAFIVWW